MNILILATLILPTSILANPKEKIDPTYFILGTLSEYNGRFISIKKTNQVDRYDSYERPVLDEIFTISRRDLKMIVGTTIDYKSPTLKYETFSKDLSLKLNSFFNEKSILNKSLFTDSIQVYSYLLGRYYRYGAKLNENIYVLRFLNFPNHTICNNILKSIGCKFYFKKKEGMPVQFIYYFIPNQHLKKYIDSITDQKATLENAYKEFYEKFWGMTDEQYSKNRKDLIEKELSEILTILK